MLGKTSYMLLGLGVTVSITAAILQLLLRKDDDEEENDEQQLPTNETSLHVHVPNQHVGAVIGRAGKVIKEIQEKTFTKISFVDPEKEEENVRIATIKGQLENVQEAKAMIIKLIEDQPNIETREIFIPSKACGRVIGKNGSSIKHICSVSNAKVTVNSSLNERDRNALQRIIIKGSKEQIENAVSMIDEKVAEEEVFCQRTAVGVAGRPLPEKMDKHNATNNITSDIPQESLEPVGSDGFLEIFVSAVEHPGCFWVQVVNTKSVQLDKMVEEMTEFYSDLSNQRTFALHDVSVGDIVAAFYYHDSSWYRARVMSIQTADNASENSAEVFYVDFGDTAVVASNLICKLKPEYMNLSTQAVECCLAGVKPQDNKWSDDATDLFEKLTHVAQWKSIMVKPVTASKSNDCVKQAQLVQIIDTCSHADVNIAEELVKGGYATWY